MNLSDRELERYSRQLMLPDFSLEQQERLRAARVLVVGCGGLGSPLALYLAAAGVGRLVLADGDRVELSNLQRQILHGEEDIGRAKAASAGDTLRALNRDCELRLIEVELAGEALESAVADVDLIADGSDNYPTRFALNRAAIARGVPLVSAAAVRSEGQLASFYPAAGGPCYRCLYPQEGAQAALSCRDSGVFGPVVGVLGALQALEVIKMLSGWGDNLVGQLLLLDLRDYSQQRLALRPRSGCPDCGAPS
ncbi:MAG: molybdopterin/thiamine biosynthesis adenylyltransferase [Halieaceae bacterium]|jgi:molybdopterin/thiamine biosynthesis adenylyltransferase